MLPLFLSSDSHVFEPPDLWQTCIETGLCEMVREDLRLGSDSIGELLSEHLSKTRVQFLAPFAQQGAVGGVLYQRVLEEVGGVRRDTAANNSPLPVSRSSPTRSSAASRSATCSTRSWPNSRPITEPTCAISLAICPSRSRRAISEACKAGEIALSGNALAANTPAIRSPRPPSSTALVSSSTNSGTFDDLIQGHARLHKPLLCKLPAAAIKQSS
jgi:hypothetical protein